MRAAKQTVTELWSKGFAALPYPHRIHLDPGILKTDAVRISIGEGISHDDVAVESLTRGLTELAPGLLNEDAKVKVLLEVHPGTVAADADVSRQAYRISIRVEGIRITGNAAPGLFYGVQTLLQLLRGRRGSFELPLGAIEDRPGRELRVLHYDTKHHQEKVEAVKSFIERAASFKINAIAWEIEDKFDYAKLPKIGAPGAFTTEEMKELTAFALRRYVEFIPIVQGPSHLAFVLKHDLYSVLREDPKNNYMACPSKDDTYKLLFAMYDELIEATPGCRFFHIGTDEPYFLGDGVDCGCRKRREEIGQGGMMAEFIARCAAHLKSRGRQALCWGEHPLRPQDVKTLPSGIINAVYQNPAMSAAYREQGIRELLYCPTQGARPLFPDYYSIETADGSKPGRIENLFTTLSHSPALKFDPLGTIIAAWDDDGLHLETFWLGYALGASWSWNAGTPGPEEATAQFFRIFHGPECHRISQAYRALDRLAHFWDTSWDQKPSKRGPSYKRNIHTRWDRTLTLPNIPDSKTLDNRSFFAARYARLLEKAAVAEQDANRALEILFENIGDARRNVHSLEVFASIVMLIRQNARLVGTLSSIERTLDRAKEDRGNVQFTAAVSKLRDAARMAKEAVTERERVFENLCDAWGKSRLPKGGKQFVHIQDDTKNHEADWTPDLGYLVMAERDLDLDGWAERLEQAAREFMKHEPNQGRVWTRSGDFQELKGYGDLEREFEE
jgi:hypothetical protein